jgi:lipopolysaccharide transport system ATP-binding protein
VDFLLRCDGEDDPAQCACHEQADLFVRVLFLEDAENIVYGMTVKTVEGTTVYATNTLLRQQPVGARQAGDIAILHFSFVTHLMPGDYFISLGVAVEDDDHGPQALDRRYDLVHLKISDSKYGYGLAALDAEFQEYQG